MRTVVAPRSRATAATRAYSASCSRSPARACGWLSDLGQEAAARNLGHDRGLRQRHGPRRRRRRGSISRLSSSTTTSAGRLDVEPADGWGGRSPARGRCSPQLGLRRAGRRARGGCGRPRSSSATLPARTPLGPRATPSRTSISKPPSRYTPSPSPAPATASVTSATRPAAARHTTLAVSSARCTPSRMIWTTTSLARERRPGDAGIAVAEAAASR